MVVGDQGRARAAEERKQVSRKAGPSPAGVSPLAAVLDQSFNRTSWHGPNLRASFRGVDCRQAVWRPGPQRHNIAEQVLHAAYWKYVVWRRLTGAKRGSFALKGSNWFLVNPPLKASAWRGYGDLLEEQHAALREAVLAMLNGNTGLTGMQFKLITGIAAHDVYHAGQIRLLRALMDSG